jgi:hypothetical protein
MAIDSVFRARLNQLISNVRFCKNLLVIENPGQDNMLNDILGTPLEDQGNQMLGDFQNSVIEDEANLLAFKALVDAL